MCFNPFHPEYLSEVVDKCFITLVLRKISSSSLQPDVYELYLETFYPLILSYRSIPSCSKITLKWKNGRLSQDEMG